MRASAVAMQDHNKIVWSPLAGSQTLAMACPAHIILYHGTRGPGKGLPSDEPVYTPSGAVPIGSLEVGDEVLQPEGGVGLVIGVYPQGTRQCYEITFDDGAIARCDDQHIWTLHLQDGNGRGLRNYPMSEVLRRHRTTSVRQHIPTLTALETVEQALPVDPYLLGLLLGDGSFTQQGSFCTVDAPIAQYGLAHGLKEWAPDKRPSLQQVRNFGYSLWLRDRIKSLGLWGKLAHEKDVPGVYLQGSPEQRLSLLQGLMDTDGTADRQHGWPTFSSSSPALARAVQYLARSLGARASIKERGTSCNGKTGRLAYSVYIQTGGKFNCFRLERKAHLVKPYQHRILWRRIVDIKELPAQETVCIKVSNPSGLFVTRDFVVTHNTDAQLMRFRRHVGQGYGRHWRGIIFDREYKNLDDLVSKSMRWFPEFKDGARFLSSKSDYRWVWPTGEELLFRAIKRETDYWGYHGQEFPFIGWNELTKYPTDTLFDMLMSCNRSSFVTDNGTIIDHETGKVIEIPEIPLEVFATCNPYGAGHNWVKKRFINASPMGKIASKTVNVFNPRTQEREDVVKTQVHLFGSYRENKYLSPEYIAELETITDPNKKKAWLGGNWDVVAGGMFDDVWDSPQHIIPPFRIPNNWRIDRSFDWGSSAPFSVGWWAESDGSDVQLPDGTWRSTVRGDIFRIFEWYGWNGKSNQGLRMLANNVAAGIIQREIGMGLYGRVQPGPADNSIWDVENGNSIAADMGKPVRVEGKKYPGVKWTRSNKSPGSRIAGWEKVRRYLSNARRQYMKLKGKKIPIPREKPGMFIFNTCTMFIDLFPILPRDEVKQDDVDTDAEDHIGDEVRYKVLSLGVGAKGGRTTGMH